MNRLQICRFRGRSLCGLLMVLIAGPSLDAAPIPIVAIRGVPPAEHEERCRPGPSFASAPRDSGIRCRFPLMGSHVYLAHRIRLKCGSLAAATS